MSTELPLHRRCCRRLPACRSSRTFMQDRPAFCQGDPCPKAWLEKLFSDCPPALLPHPSMLVDVARPQLSPAQQREPPDGQPLGDQNVAIVEKNGIMRRNEFSWRKLWARLAASRSDIAVLALAISQLHQHLMLTIEDTHLAIQ